MFKRLTLLGLFAASCIAGTAHADIGNFSGTTEGGPTFVRPVEDFSAISGIGTNVSFSVLAFTVSTSGEYSFLTTATFDAITLLYGGAFDASTPLLNGLIGNDDLVSSTTSGFAYELAAGTTYYHVTTSFFNGDAGAFSLTVGGPGVVTAVPEPAAWMMAAFGLAALSLARRRSQQG